MAEGEMPGQENQSDTKDQKQGAPQRLQGLSSRGGARGGLRGGRFAPNAVGRRSKEERDSSAPAQKVQDSREDANSRPLQRGKMDRRKSRQMGTRAEAAGPLAAPTIAASGGARMPAPPSGGGDDGRSISASRSTGTVKSEQEIESLQAHLIVGDDGRIDVASGGDGEAFFPLRVASTANSTGIADDVEQLGTLECKAATEVPGELEAQLEGLHGSDAVNLSEGELYLVQLPKLGHLAPGKAPKGAALNGIVKQEDEEMPDVLSASASTSASATTDAPMDDPTVGREGRLGTLRRHKSGRTTLLIGDAVFDVSLGSNIVSVEDVLLLNEETHTAYPLGSIKSKVLVTPNLDSLHI